MKLIKIHSYLKRGQCLPFHTKNLVWKRRTRLIIKHFNQRTWSLFAGFCIFLWSLNQVLPSVSAITHTFCLLSLWSDRRYAPITLHMRRPGIARRNNCTALQLCHTGISSITGRLAENEEKVEYVCVCVRARWVGRRNGSAAFVYLFPNFYMIFLTDPFTVLADQQNSRAINHSAIEHTRWESAESKLTLTMLTAAIWVVTPCVDESLFGCGAELQISLRSAGLIFRANTFGNWQVCSSSKLHCWSAVKS